jgi:hypothetical protein
MKSYRGFYKLVRIEIGDRCHSHELSAVLMIQARGQFNLLHLVASRDRDTEALFD